MEAVFLVTSSKNVKLEQCNIAGQVHKSKTSNQGTSYIELSFNKLFVIWVSGE